GLTLPRRASRSLGRAQTRSAALAGRQHPAARSAGDDHAGTPTAPVAPVGSDARRAAPTMAALTTRIETRPTHWRASPMPSPQYGLVGPTSAGTRWKNVNAAISVQATTAATRAADRCPNASRTPAIRT